MLTRSFASRFDSGSSIRNAAGSRTIARPIATRCRWPPESAAGRRSSSSSSPSSFATSADAAVDLGLRRLADLEPVAEVLAHGHVRVERVVLEDHRDVAVARRELGHVALADEDRPLGDVLEAGDHPHQRRLAAAGRPDEHHELAARDLERDVVGGLHVAGVDLGHVVDDDPAHAVSFGGAVEAAHSELGPEDEVWQRPPRLVDEALERADRGLGDVGDRLLDRGQRRAASTTPPRCRRSRPPRGRPGRRDPARRPPCSTPIAIRSLEQTTPVGGPPGAASSARSAVRPPSTENERVRDETVGLDARGDERLRPALRLVAGRQRVPIAGRKADAPVPEREQVLGRELARPHVRRPRPT